MLNRISRHWLVRIGLCTVLVASLAGCLVEATDEKVTFPEDRAEAWRFLNHATFGPTERDIARVTVIGYENWIDEQFSRPLQTSYRQFLTQRTAEIKAETGAGPRPEQVIEGFYTRALTDPAQLRQRVVFALSEIFVVSMIDTRLNEQVEMVAGYMDTLDSAGMGDYRHLLEAVTKSPAMGMYLTYRSNQKEEPSIGRIPDENYAREVMQLFSIGLHELNLDGTPVLGSNGQPKETYTSDDVQGLAKVFTGWSNYRGPAFASQTDNDCFWVNTACNDPEAAYQPMQAYPVYSSTSATSFLGTSIGARSSADPAASLMVAMDTLAKHRNAAPFFSKQMIQRLVTSNPSPAYVARVAQRFLDTNGSIKDVVKAILVDPEAIGSPLSTGPTDGKVREPILRLTAILRAFTFDGPGLHTGGVRVKNVGITSTTDAAQSFGQSPFYSPSVFNFFRPGYVPPQSHSAEAGMVAPEMQITNESSVTGYVNSVQNMLMYGIGSVNGQPGIQLDYSELRPQAKSSAQLAAEMSKRLLGGTMSDALRQEITTALDTMVVPTLDASSSNLAAVNDALDLRSRAAILMTAASPEFLIQK